MAGGTKQKKVIVEEDTYVDEDYEEESFLDDQDSREAFTEKYNIKMLGNDIPLGDGTFHTNNNMHHIYSIVPNDKRITSEMMTRAEYTRVVGERAKQIEGGSPIFVDVEFETDPIKIAEKEIRGKRCPLKISRRLKKHIIEIWQVNEMVPPFDMP
jgi:DNA-directed RNA polymerase I, II, and III subunit RPABC2